MVKKPVIGISVAHVKEELETFPRHFYIESIRLAGGVPVILPLMRAKEEALEYLNLIDGLLLSGGGDISPLHLGEDPWPGVGNCLPERDLSELLLAKVALDEERPVLGICRGIQVLAVAAGGRIYQDIPSQHPQALKHSQTAPRRDPWHWVNIAESRLADIVGVQRIAVNSFHHQAVSSVPPGFRRNAAAPDGIIEGIERMGTKFCLGVQWHPESMEGDSYSAAIFAAFVQACRER